MRRHAIVLSSLFLWFGLMPLAIRAEVPACQPETTVEAVVAEAGSTAEILELSPEAWRERLARVEEALAAHPDALFLHRTRQDLLRYGPKDVREERMPGLREEYAGLREERPGEPAFLYLHWRIADEAGEAALREALESDPDFPWAHLGLVVEALGDEDSRNDAERHLERFMELCPDRTYEALLYAGRAGSAEFWRTRVPELRDRLRSDPEAHLRAFPSFWDLEFRLAELDEHPTIRERVGEDVAFLEERFGTAEPASAELLEVLQEGYELAGRGDRAAEVEARLLAADPCSMDATTKRIESWREEYREPIRKAPKAEQSALWKAFSETTRAWTQRCPDQYLHWHVHLLTLLGVDDVDPAEIVATGERMVTAYAAWRGYATPSGFEIVAKAFLDEGLAPERALELVDRAETAVRSRRENLDLSRLSDGQRERIEGAWARSDWQRELLRARALVAEHELAAAEALLDELRPALDALAPDEDAVRNERMSHRSCESAYRQALAEHAEAAGRPADAVAFYLQAEALTPPRPIQPAPSPDRIRERAAALWADLGGTDAGLEALRAVATEEAAAEREALAEASPWTEADEALPAFELTDLSGRTWTSADLAGKTVFINAWATWCGPCRQELPAVQVLHERVKDRDDLVVLTFNSDADLGGVAPYLQKNGFDFPVLLADDYLEDELEVFAIPQSWIVDAGGTVRREQSGYDPAPGEERWVADTLAEMESVAGASEGR